MGCAHRCTFCYVRGFERRADRPSDDRYGRSIRVKVNVAEVLARELRAPVLEARVRRGRSGHRSLPAGRGPLSADARLHPGVRRGPHSLQHRHARADDHSRHRRAAGRGLAGRGPRELLGTDARPGGLAANRAGHGTAAPAAAGAARAGRGRDRRRRRDGADPARASPTIRSSSPRSCGRRATRAPPASGATSCYLRPGTREHFLENLARDWPALLPRYEALYSGHAYPEARRAEPIKARVAALRERFEIADRRPSARAAAWPAQLGLAI